MTRWWESIVFALPCLMVLVLTLIPLSAAQKAAAQSSPAVPIGQEVPERWGFFFDSGGWHLGYQATDGREAIREYVVQGETVHNWRKLVTSHYYNLDVTPKVFFQRLAQSATQRCPGLKISVIEETPDTIIFEWENGNDCDGQPPQRQLHRISRGRPGVLSLQFAEKRPYSDENRDLWLSILRNAVVLESRPPAPRSEPAPASRSLPASALGPRPANEVSEYLETLGTGVAIDTRDRVARLVITLKPTRRLPPWAYLEAHFENPVRASDPIVVGETWDARDDKVLIGTPPLKELKCWNYEVVVYVYQDQTKAKLLGTHHQRIQSTVNLQKADFDKNLQDVMRGASCP